MSGWYMPRPRPVIVPETIVCDHGKAYLSATFRAACRSLGISLAPAHPHTPTDKAGHRAHPGLGRDTVRPARGRLGRLQRRAPREERRGRRGLVDGRAA